MWRWPTTGRFLEYMKITYGWSLILIVVVCVLYFRYLDARSEDRLAGGIDPPWMTPPPDRAACADDDPQPTGWLPAKVQLTDDEWRSNG